MQAKTYYIVNIVTVEPEKILNLVQRQSIAVWDADYRGGILSFKIISDQLERVRHITDRFGAPINVAESLGMEKTVSFFKKRKYFFASFVLACFTVVYLAQFIWKIEIYGTRSLSESDIIQTLFSNGYKQSTRKKALDLNEAEVVLLKEYPQLDQATVEIEGSVLLVTISERDSPIVQFDKSVPVDIVAARAAQIDEFDVYSGVGMVKVGDQVKEGDVLISGVVRYSYRSSPSSEQVHALGKALTYESITFEAIIEMYVPQSGAPHRSEKTYHFLGRSIAFSKKSDDDWLSVDLDPLPVSIGWIELPILYNETRWYNKSSCRLKTEQEINKEILDIATSKLSPKQTIQNVDYKLGEISEKMAHVIIIIDCKTNIALEQELR